MRDLHGTVQAKRSAGSPPMPAPLPRKVGDIYAPHVIYGKQADGVQADPTAVHRNGRKIKWLRKRIGFTFAQSCRSFLLLLRIVFFWASEGAQQQHPLFFLRDRADSF